MRVVLFWRFAKFWRRSGLRHFQKYGLTYKEQIAFKMHLLQFSFNWPKTVQM